MALHNDIDRGGVVAFRAPARVLWRGALLAGCLLAMAVAFAAGDPAPALRADPALATLLRGMAALKALMVLAAFAMVWWRFGRAISPVAGASYVVALAAMAAGAVLIWQLSFIGVTAIGFHAALIGLFVMALRDDSLMDRRSHASRR